MNQRAESRKAIEARRWAIRLTARVQRVLVLYPNTDPDNVRHTLILLEQPPLERLQRSLTRARATAIFRKRTVSVESFSKRKVRFMLVGLSAATLQGARSDAGC